MAVVRRDSVLNPDNAWYMPSDECDRSFSIALSKATVPVQMESFSATYPSDAADVVWQGRGAWLVRISDFVSDAAGRSMDRLFARTDFYRSTIGDTTVETTVRDSWSGACLRDGSPLVYAPCVTAVLRRLTRLFGLTDTSRFSWEVEALRYPAGGHFELHHDDELAPGVPARSRGVSFLLYLSTLEPGQGGATVFPNLDARFRPVAGTLVAWRNYSSKDGSLVSRELLHTADPVSGDAGGEFPKRALNIWYYPHGF